MYVFTESIVPMERRIAEDEKMSSLLVWIIDEEWADYEVEKKLLKERLPEAEIRYSGYNYEKDLEEFGYRADLILAQVYTAIDEKVMNRLERCKGIAVYGGGYDRIDVEAAKKKGIMVTNVQGYCADDLAEYVMAAIYNYNKKILCYRSTDGKGAWGAGAVPKIVHRVSASTLFIVGCGTIGKRVAKYAIGAGMRVIGYDKNIPSEELKKAGIEAVSWEEGFEQADYVSVHVKYTKETHHIIGKDEFSLMKQTAYLINTARGGILNENELLEAVRNKEIAGATVDVISVEPPKGDEDIWNCPDIIVTPHISYISEESFHTLKVRTVENALKMLHGEKPDDLVNG